MSPGNLTLTCLLLVAGQAPADLVYFNQRAMKIPIDIEPARRREVKEFILYVSADRGKSWDPSAREAPDKEFFAFRAPADGEYWFRIAAKNLQGRQEPENIYAGPPQQKVLIDTLHKPSLRIASARRVGQELVVAWEAQSELPPDPTSMKLEYRMLDGSASVWFPVGLTPGPTGEARTRVLSPGRVAVRMQFRDVAGNLASHEAEVPGADGIVSNSSPLNQGALPAPPPPAPIVPVTGAPETSLPPPGVAGPSKLAVPPPVAPGVAAQSSAGSPVSPPNPPAPLNPPQPVGGGPERVPGQTLARGGNDSEPVATTPQRGQTAPQPGPPTPASAPHRAAPPVRLVNTREVALEYQLSRLGPSGIGSVILYLTADGGQKWAEFKDEKPDLTNAAIGSKYQRVLTLPPGEGVYGLILVVQNKGKIGKPKPKPGDVPEMIIEVDLTPPNAKLWGPQVDPERRDAVVLQWAAQDKNLPANPVILEWAEKAQGPWKVIAADLPGTGKHSWQVPAGTPVEVYLRLRVRDNAGNEAVAVTDTPQTIDLVEPEGQLIGVHPVGH
jgi:hypothetical protein